MQIKVNCYKCKKEFERSLCKYNETKKRGAEFYCSRNCFHSGRKSYKMSSNGGLKEIKCDECQKIFNKQQNQINLTKNHFCSKQCNTIYQIKHPTNTVEHININCPSCKNDFLLVPSDYKRRFKNSVLNLVFCSKECKGIYCRDNKIGIFSDEYIQNSENQTGLRSQLELFIEQKINNYFPYLLVNTNERTIVTPYELDFWIPDLNLAIEINGPCHYKPIYGEEHLKIVQSHDFYKQKYCNEKQIQLLIILNMEKFSENNAEKIWNNEIKSMFLSKIPYCENQ